MADWRSMYEGKYLGAWNLVDAEGNKRDCVVMIEKVEASEIVGDGGKKNKKPLIYFRGKSLPMVVGKTVGKTIAAMYGNETRAWSGKRITLYSTTTSVGGEEKDCIRVRPLIPSEPTVKEKSDGPAE
jgi:hypothetical protein